MALPNVNLPLNRGPHNPYNPAIASATSVTTDSAVNEYEAFVIDVITNDKHKKYQSDGYNVGAIQFRSIATDKFKKPEFLNWALPADTNVTDYPLINEIVMVFSALNRWYWHRRLNVTSTVTSHAMPGMAAELGPIDQANNQQSQRNTALNGNPSVKNSNTSPPQLGRFFKEPTNLWRLRHDEGDVIVEGRSGSSIRLGASWKTGTQFQASKDDQRPNILFRVGQDPKAKPSVNTAYGLVSEDIDKDDTSFYMVSDQFIPLTLSTANAVTNGLSIRNFPRRLDGAQIVMNTDRIVLNAKKTKIMGFALDGIHWTSSKDFSVDADQDYLSHVNRDIKIWLNGNYSMTTKGTNSFIAPKNYLGTQNDESQPLPMGAALAQFLSDFIDALTQSPPQHTIVTTVDSKGDAGQGFGALNPGIVTALEQLKADVAKGKYASFNSTNSYTTK
jgi:hypothetical protein